MEALAAFYFGKTYKVRTINSSNFITPNEYLSSSRLFIDLFKNSSELSEGTNSKVRGRFYEKIRCGLVHEARTKGSELIISNISRKNTKPNQYYYKDGNHYIFNRDLFLDKLLKHFYKTLTELKQKENFQLRRNLVFKIDEICNIKHIWYFTYGSNLKEEQMDKRLSKLDDFYLHKQICHIKDYRFLYNKKSIDGSSKGNIENSKDEKVIGIAYLMKSETYQKFMAKFEIGYESKILIANYEDKCFEVKTAISRNITTVLPKKDYRNIIINGAKQQKLDEEYIEKYLMSKSID